MKQKSDESKEEDALKETDEELLKKAEANTNAKIKGVYNKDIAECAQDDLKKVISDDTLKVYEKATEVTKSLPSLNPTGLGLVIKSNTIEKKIEDTKEKNEGLKKINTRNFFICVAS